MSTSAVTAQFPPHLYMPASGIAFSPAAYIPFPAAPSAPTVVLQFSVPSGTNGIIWQIGNVFVGGGWQEGTGNIVWQLLADGGAIRNFENILASLGGVSTPCLLSGGILIKEGQVIQLTVQNNAIPGGPFYAGGRMGGWFYPKELESADTWL